MIDKFSKIWQICAHAVSNDSESDSVKNGVGLEKSNLALLAVNQMWHIEFGCFWYMQSHFKNEEKMA